MMMNPSPIVSAKQEESPPFPGNKTRALEPVSIEEQQLEALLYALDILFEMADTGAKTDG